MIQEELAGVVVPAITPVDDDDRVDELAYRCLIRYLIASGVDAIFVGGSAGEGPLLVQREWERMINIAFDEVNGKVNLLGGAIDTSTRRVQDKLRVLRGIGYRYCVITPTYYITLRAPEEYLRLFGECVDVAGGVQLVAYNIPSCVGSAIPIDGLLEMARRGWIQYCKESSGDFAYFSRLVSEGAELGLRVLQGEESHIAVGMLAGACGIVPVCANFEPRTFVAAYHAGLVRDEATLGSLQKRILLVRESLLFAGYLWIAGVKYALSQLGYGSGRPVSPLEPLSATQKATIDAFIERQRAEA